MANPALKQWAIQFAKAVSDFDNAVNTYIILSKRGQFGFVTSKPAQNAFSSAQNNLIKICDSLPAVLDTGNKEKILTGLRIILSKVILMSLNVKGSIFNSYYKDFSAWLNTYIKPLV